MQPGSETGKDLEFTYGGIPDPEALEAHSFIEGMLKAAGMKVSSYTIEQTQLINTAVSRNFVMLDWQNFPGSDPDSLFVWWNCPNAPPVACDNLINFGGFNDAQINSDFDKARGEVDPAKAKALYEDVNRQFGKGIYNIWVSYTLWSVGTSTKVHGLFGPPLPDGSKPNTSLANGHAMSGLFVTP